MIRAKLYEKKRLEADTAVRNERKEQLGSGERHEKIRTYHFHQDRVTDHRVGLTFNGVESFMAGETDLDELVEQLALQEETASISALIDRHHSNTQS